MKQKDVLRTNRARKFYADSEDNGNIVKLFNILITYALNHPKVCASSRAEVFLLLILQCCNESALEILEKFHEIQIFHICALNKKY